MKVIKSVEYYEVDAPNDMAFAYKSQEPTAKMWNPNFYGPIPRDPCREKEVIKGQRFMIRHGAEVEEDVIGLTEEAAKTLGLVFESHTLMREELNRVHKTDNKVRKLAVRYKTNAEKYLARVEEINQAGIWSRIKFILGLTKI